MYYKAYHHFISFNKGIIRSIGHFCLLLPIEIQFLGLLLKLEVQPTPFLEYWNFLSLGDSIPAVQNKPGKNNKCV